MGRFAAAHRPDAVGDYAALWAWSVDDLPGFWQAVWDFFELESSAPVGEVLADPTMPAPTFFDGARVNYAAHMLRGNGLGDDGRGGGRRVPDPRRRVVDAG